MNSIAVALTELFDRIPRRHSVENVKEINSITADYEDVLIGIEAVNTFYEKNTTTFFDEIDLVKTLVKKSTDNKVSKKSKDDYFNEASGKLKDSMQSLIIFYADGNRTS